MISKLRNLLICVFFTQIAYGQQYTIELIQTGVNTSIRGLSALNDSTIWASGSNGYVGKSENGGKTWQFKQIPGYDSAEFRDIEVLSEKTILVMSSVQPACILKSTDGGEKWKVVFKDDRPEVFLDAIDFAGKKGVCIGDPINNKFFILHSNNKGDTWTAINSCIAPDSVAAFAASGSTIQYFKKGQVFFATGGSKTLLYYSDDHGATWLSQAIPLQTGAPSKGIFSIDFLDPTIGCAVGGDYLTPNDYTGNFTMLVKNDTAWKAPLSLNPNGYRSCIKFIEPTLLITCGSTGVDIADKLNWFNISLESFNVIAVTPKSKHVILAGGTGKIGLLKIN